MAAVEPFLMKKTKIEKGAPPHRYYTKSKGRLQYETTNNKVQRFTPPDESWTVTSRNSPAWGVVGNHITPKKGDPDNEKHQTRHNKL